MTTIRKYNRYNRIDSKIPNVFNLIRPGATFMAVRGYTNNFGEVSDFGIVFHFNYMNAVRKAINTWARMFPADSISKQAKYELLVSYGDTLKYGFNHRARSAHAYVPVQDAHGKIINGVKLHLKNQELHLVGLLVHKRIIKPGEYDCSTQSALTLAKQELMSKTPLSNYRQFKLVNGRFDSISVDSLNLTQKDLIRKVA